MVLFTDWSIEKYYLKYVTITNLWQILSWSWRASPSLERMDCQVLKQNQHFKGRFNLTSGVVGVRGWWWWRGGRRSGIDLPVLTFHLAAALAIKLAEGRPEAGLPPHNEMKKGVERAFWKGNIFKDKFWEGILWSEHYLVCWTQKTILGDKGHIM